MDMRYFRVYDGVFNEECELLLNHFSHGHKEQFENPVYKFDQHTLNPSISRVILDKLRKLAATYVKDVGIEQYQFPTSFNMETPRIKRYYDQTCLFNDHVDVRDANSSKRFLSFLVYLNTVDEGGGTEFFTADGSILINPVEGRVVVFPPMWTYPHKAHPVIRGEKYIMSSYLHYV